MSINRDNVKNLQKAPLITPTDLDTKGVAEISGALNAVLADVFALYLKTKNFHWHVSGPHFRDYHLLLDDQASEIIGISDDIAERARKIGGTTLRSIGQIAQLQRIKDNNADYVEPADMLAELVEDNKLLVRSLRAIHEVCEKYGDTATSSMLDDWIDQAERRTWFLFESSKGAKTSGH